MVQGKKIMLVDFDMVKLEHDMDAVEGANYMEASWVPKPEIWVDANLSPHDWPPICYHEYQECCDMEENDMSYNKAHDRANHNERILRERLIQEHFAREEANFFQYQSNEQIVRDMIARKQNVPQTAPTTAPAGWTIYHGPHGGVGWKQMATGKVLYATTGRSPFTLRPGSKEALPTVKQLPERKKEDIQQGGMALARWYSDHWNLMESLGLKVPETEKQEAALELYGKGVAIKREDDSPEGKWIVVKAHPKPEPPPPTQPPMV
jgi:hypothetical protein